MYTHDGYLMNVLEGSFSDAHNPNLLHIHIELFVGRDMSYLLILAW